MDILSLIGFKRAPAPVVIQSRPQDYYLPAIAVGAQFELSIDVHVPDMRQYKPLNFVEVYNDSNTVLQVRVEAVGGERFRIAANSKRTLRLAFNNLIFTNVGPNALAANTCMLTLQRL